MKIAVCSDLHLEFGDLDLTNDDNADVLILGGDIFVAEDLNYLDTIDNVLMPTRMNLRAKRYFDFVERCCEQFPNVILIMGNHEHYHGDFATTGKLVQNTFANFDNLHFLDKDASNIEGVTFFGGTLWTDMNREDPITMQQIRSMMNDFNCVKNTEAGGRFMPEDAVADHKKFLQNLNGILDQNPVVVVGHHAPTKMSTHPYYKDQYLMNGGYSSDLSEFILDNRNIKLWTHGHTHHEFDYMIGTCRVVCNPRGYDGHEERADHFQLKYLEV